LRAKPGTKTTGPTKPTKKELAQMKALSDLGLTPTAVAKLVGRSHHTVIKYLDSEVYNDPEIGAIVSRIKEKEAQDLSLLGAKARKWLHVMLDEGRFKPIETIALMDRAFQQRRLLEGVSTENISLHVLVQEMERKREAALKKAEAEGREKGEKPPAPSEDAPGQISDGGDGAGAEEERPEG